MAHIHPHVFFGDTIVPKDRATLNIATSAVLYGLSVYTVFPLLKQTDGTLAAFRLRDHHKRLLESAHIIGLDTFAPAWDYPRFEAAVRDLVKANGIAADALVRVSVHASAEVPGTRARGLPITVSMFVYEAPPIVPPEGARLKVSVWRRIPDESIPSRAKVNGAYVNSVLAKQDALDCGYDDAVFLDAQGHVCEASAANIFMVRNGVLVTPGTANDNLDGINRRTVLAAARALGIPAEERAIDLTELYIADEVFLCGTSAAVAQVSVIDARKVGTGQAPVTAAVREKHRAILRGEDKLSAEWLTAF
jgi:branched-chain amino acid aminotransferase